MCQVSAYPGSELAYCALLEQHTLRYISQIQNKMQKSSLGKLDDDTIIRKTVKYHRHRLINMKSSASQTKSPTSRKHRINAR